MVLKALQSKAQRGAERERSRCADIIRRHRAELLKLAAEHPHASNIKSVRQMIQRLFTIEREIMGIAAEEPLPVVYPGDFSIDEMEWAQKLIEDQERNPFEVEP